MLVGSRKEDNWQRADRMITQLAGQGAELVILPEIFNSPYQTHAFPENAEEFPGPTTDLLAQWAKKNRVYIVGGSIPEKEAGKIYNTCFTFDDQGNCIARYRKIHLCDIDIPGRVRLQESETLSPGKDLVYFTYRNIKVGINICYDLRFPELSRYLAINGIDLLVVPAAFSYPTGQDHWSLLMQARAIDNQFFVAAVSPARNFEAKFKIWGHSMLVDPWGRIIGEADDKEQAMLVKMDLDVIRRVRQELPVLTHRREDIYQIYWPSLEESNI